MNHKKGEDNGLTRQTCSKPKQENTNNNMQGSATFWNQRLTKLSTAQLVQEGEILSIKNKNQYLVWYFERLKIYNILFNWN